MSFFYQLSVITGVFNVLIFILVGAIKIETAVKAIDKKKNAKRIENKSNVETSWGIPDILIHQKKMDTQCETKIQSLNWFYLIERFSEGATFWRINYLMRKERFYDLRHSKQ